MNLRYALLALLDEGEAHGYGLRKRFTQRVGPFWHPNIGQIYQVLHELERRGYVTRRDVTSGARLRRLFRLTLRGERALRTWLARRPAWPPPLRDEILVRVLATERQGAATLLAQLERQEAEYRRYLTLVQAEDGHDVSLTRRLAREAAVGIAEAYLRWLARCRELLVRRPEPRLGSESGGDGGAAVARASGVPRPAEPARHACHARDETAAPRPAEPGPGIDSPTRLA